MSKYFVWSTIFCSDKISLTIKIYVACFINSCSLFCFYLRRYFVWIFKFLFTCACKNYHKNNKINGYRNNGNNNISVIGWICIFIWPCIYFGNNFLVIFIFIFFFVCITATFIKNKKWSGYKISILVFSLYVLLFSTLFLKQFIHIGSLHIYAILAST